MRLARLIAKTLVALAAIAFLGGIILFVLAVHVMTWPYRSTHGNRRKGQIEALLALGTSLAALLAAFSARSQAKEARLQADRDEREWEHHKAGREQDRKQDRKTLRRMRLGWNPIGEQAEAERQQDDDIPY